jgi:hypothetical protein
MESARHEEVSKLKASSRGGNIFLCMPDHRQLQE